MDQQVVVESTTLLEREHELERVRNALRAVGQRAGGVLAIEGPPGIGKSRLLIEARSRGEQRGLRILTARATELEQGYPFGVVRQLFERALVEAEPDVSERWLSGAAALAADVLGVAPGGAAPSVSEGPATGDTGYAWQHGLYWLASNISSDAPLVLLVDDLQWCDVPSVRALTFIARRLGGQPLSLILATRPSDPILASEVAALLTDPATEMLRPLPLTRCVGRRIDPGPSGARAARSLRRRMHRRDRRQPVFDRRAARRGRRSGHRPEHLRRCRRARHDRPARRREHGPAAAWRGSIRPPASWGERSACSATAPRSETPHGWLRSPPPIWSRRWRRSSPPA